ncbi:MAG: NBR1-Ig-like domain-containing protein [Anaerolineales bacterium]
MTEETISAREKEVIELLLQGKSNKQIALALRVANRTVEFHLSNIYAKLGVTSRTEAVLKLSETGLRESTGEAGSGNMRESTVEKNDKAADNGSYAANDGSKSFSLRSMPMKNLLYVIGTLVLTTALIVTVTLFATPGGRSDIVPDAQPSQTADQGAGSDPTGEPVTQTPGLAITPEANSTAIMSTEDVAQFVSETIPDWTNIPAGTSFTKTWTFRNAGTTTWTTGYFLKLTSASYPLGQTLNLPDKISLTKSIKPGETVDVSVNLQAPATDGTYSFHWQMQTPAGQIVSGDGYDIWATFTVGDVAMNNSYSQGNISLELVSVEKDAAYTNVHICAQYPDTQDWNPSGVTLTAGSVQASIESYSLDNAKSPSTAGSTYRCFTLGFPVGTGQYGETPVSVTISSYRVLASTHLEANCTRTKQQLANLYPGLDFTCGPAGFYYTSVVLPGHLSSSQADKIIMDALEQAVYGPWTLTE